MKRAIFILFTLVIAFILLDKVLPRKQPSKKEAFNPSGSNVVASQTFPTRLQRAAEPLQIASTKSSVTNEDEGTEWQKLSRGQVDAYLAKTKRSPESLLNAFQETGDTNFLAEAVKNHSDNLLVQWTMLNQENSPEEHAKWLEKLKMSSPDNALPNYLSALDDFKAGKTDQALAEIDSASKKKLSAYEKERAQSREEMYLLSGYSPLEAKENSSKTLVLPNLSEMKQLAVQIGYLQQKYKAAGDNGSNEQLAAVEIEIGRKYSEPDSSFLVNQLVGYAIENNALRNLDSEANYDFLGKTAGERIQEIKDQRQKMKDLRKIYNQNYSTFSDAEKMIFKNRQALYGELNAMRWVKQNYGSETK